jgi:hypothetical protein
MHYILLQSLTHHLNYMHCIGLQCQLSRRAQALLGTRTSSTGVLRATEVPKESRGKWMQSGELWSLV